MICQSELEGRTGASTLMILAILIMSGLALSCSKQDTGSPRQDSVLNITKTCRRHICPDIKEIGTDGHSLCKLWKIHLSLR